MRLAGAKRQGLVAWSTREHWERGALRGWCTFISVTGPVTTLHPLKATMRPIYICNAGRDKNGRHCLWMSFIHTSRQLIFY